MNRTRAIAIGASAGGVQALLELLPRLPSDLPVPVLIVLHVPPDRSNLLAPLLDAQCAVSVKEAEDKETLQPGTVYFAPSDYHLLVETSGELSLSSEEAVNFSRPSIDVLFESAADAYGPDLVAILLTGANNDGACGLARVAAAGGTALIQDPATAQARAMPEAGLRHCPNALVKSLPEIAEHTKTIARA